MWINSGPRYGSPQLTFTFLMYRGGWSGGPGRGFAGRGQWLNSGRSRGSPGYGRGFETPLEDKGPNERYEDPTPRPGPNAEPRPGRGRGRSRGCHVCGTFGCHSRNHAEEQAAELRHDKQPRSPGLRETVSGVRQWATELRHFPSARSHNGIAHLVRSTVDSRPDLD